MSATDVVFVAEVDEPAGAVLVDCGVDLVALVAAQARHSLSRRQEAEEAEEQGGISVWRHISIQR